MNKVFRFARALSVLANPSTWGVFTETAEISKFDAAFSISYSQGGEDIALMFDVLQSTDGAPGRYIDVGAHDPNRFSITRRLYAMGWTGVNIDANRDFEAKFKKWRPKDEWVWGAVGLQKNYTFTVFEESAISTANEKWKSDAVSTGNRIVREFNVPGVSLREIQNSYFRDRAVDLINIDIEGGDLEALISLDLPSLAVRLKPQWLLLESSPPLKSALSTPAVEYAISNGYVPWLVLPMGTLLRNASN